jgi:ribose transport system ATP-binding protein
MADDASVALPVVRIRGLSKTFPGQQALRDVSLSLRAGEVHALCGQNGSGKSTLIKLLSGYHHPDPGARIELLGNEIRPWRGEGQRQMHFIHQELGLIDSLNVVENLALGHGYGARGLMPISWRRQTVQAHRLLLRLGIDIDVRQPVGELTSIERTMIAVARALRGWESDTGLLVLDEPTVAMSKPEVDRLFTAIREIAGRGAAVLYVSHRLEEVFAVAQWVSVLREGSLVMSESVASVKYDDVVEAVAGRQIGAHTRASPNVESRERLALSAKELYGNTVRGASLAVASGEILGVTGLAGSGVDDLAELLFGGLPLEAGEIELNGERVGKLSPHRAKRLGMALVPANRAVKGCIPAFSARENMTLPLLSPLQDVTGIRRRRERHVVIDWMQRVELRPLEPELALAAFSGGNQQKAVIARWLRLEPKVLILHEPTQGVDVGARVAIRQLLTDAASRDTAIIVCSCDVVDLLKLCDRLLVMDAGRIVDELSGTDLTEERVWTALLSTRPAESSAV